MILLADTGPLVAIIDKRDGHHARAFEIFRTIKSPLATTEACLTESLYLLGDAAGWQGQSLLRKMILSGELSILSTPSDGPHRSLTLMEKFRDIPCDYADSSLLVAAEETGLRSIVTFDSHFNAYRITNGENLTVLS